VGNFSIPQELEPRNPSLGLFYFYKKFKQKVNIK